MKRRGSVAVRVIGLLIAGMIIYSLVLFTVINRQLTEGFLNYIENTLVYQSEGVQNYIDDISAQGQELLNVIRDITEDELLYEQVYFNFNFVKNIHNH